MMMPRRKTTRRQLEEMLNFLRTNRVVLNGKTKASEAGRIKYLWQQFAVTANALGDGPQKSADQWRHVFNEWKMNTKRKSRKIFSNIGGTGGGPSTGKDLTDLEKQLLELISKIHLGDEEVQDSLGMEPLSPQAPAVQTYKNPQPSTSYNEKRGITIIQPTFEDVKEEIANDSDEHLYEPEDNFKLEVEPNTWPDQSTKETPQPQKKKLPPTTTTASRYASANIRQACEHFSIAQKAIAEKETQSMEVQRAMVKIKKGKLKLKYYKVYGNCDDFDKWYASL